MTKVQIPSSFCQYPEVSADVPQERLQKQKQTESLNGKKKNTNLNLNLFLILFLFYFINFRSHYGKHNNSHHHIPPPPLSFHALAIDNKSIGDFLRHLVHTSTKSTKLTLGKHWSFIYNLFSSPGTCGILNNIAQYISWNMI